MAYVLSLSSSDPLQRPFAEPHYMRSCSSVGSQFSSGTVRHTYPRSISPSSLQSSSSLPRAPWPLPDEHPLPRLASRTVLNYIHDFDIPTTNTPDVEPLPDSCGSSVKSFVSNADGSSAKDKEACIDQSCDDDVVPFPPLDTTICELRDSSDAAFLDFTPECANTMLPSGNISTNSPFKRWLSTLRRRHPSQRLFLPEAGHWPGLLSSPRSVGLKKPGHQKSLSLTSSLGLVTAVKSASITLAGTSSAPRSRRAPHQGHFHSDTTSGSCFEPRMSTDSSGGLLEPVIDEKAWYRSAQRRNIVEEILTSEESYVTDMKAMMHVYFTLLASAPTVSPRRRDSIQKSISQIIQLHEELLAELQKVIPNSTPPQGYFSPQRFLRRSKHARWHSVETALVPLKSARMHRRFRHSVDFGSSASQSACSLVVTTNTVLNVAKVFDKFMRHFLTYEAYVAHNEIVNDEACTTSRLIPAWNAYERGVEALAASTIAIDQRDTNSRKGLTLADLGIKPVQRICKYPLFFSDLCRQTPACDDPVVHAELEKVLLRLQETAEEINNARDNPKTRCLIETTWLLQDRLIFHDELYKATVLRLLGRVVLCGALHVAYEGSDRVNGQYMVCILYRSWLVLATVGTNSFLYNVDAVIPIFNASIEAPDNGRGLQCHTAPYTWKFVFQYQQRYYELLMSACSELEEEEWKSHFRSRITVEARDTSDNRPNTSETFSYSQLDVKALGPAFEAHSGFARRLSIRRAATLGPKTNLRQVIIKNTHAQKSGQNEAEDTTLVMRSKSHMSSSNITTLAPRRSERIRLEGLLSDVWSRENLPYPGMAVRRLENPIKASANSVMRKLSMASIASNFSKRSASFNGLNNRQDDIRAVSQRAFYAAASRTRRLDKRRSSRVLPAVVDFHTAPSAFLPEDFELKKPTITTRRQKFVKRAMTLDSTTSSPMVSLPLPRVSPAQAECASTVQMRLVKESSPQQESEDSGYSSIDRTDTLVQAKHHKDSSSPHPSSNSVRGPVKAKSLLFKLLGVQKD